MASVDRVDTKWFQGKLIDRQLSQRKLAARLGLDPAAVSLMLRGRRKMTVGEAKEIARALGVEVSEVLAHFGSNVVAGPGLERERDGQGNGRNDLREDRREERPRVVASGEWEADFMRRWIELGSMLLRRGG